MMLLRKIISLSLFLVAGIIFFSCKTSTDASSNNNFSADVSYDGSTAVHYVSDDYHIHFNRVSGNIDTLIITADRGEKADMFAELFMELDSIHTGMYPINSDAPYTHKGIRLDHTSDDGTFYTSKINATDSLTITDLDVAKQAVKGTFHCTLYQDGIPGGKKVDITNGTFSWNF